MQVGRLHDELKKTRHELKKVTNERDYYRSQWEKEKYQNSMQHTNPAATTSAGEASVAQNSLGNGSGMAAVTSASSTSAGHHHSPLNAHSMLQAHHPHHPINAHLPHHAAAPAGLGDQLVDLRLTTSGISGGNASSNHVEDYKRVYAANAAVASLAAEKLNLSTLR